MHHTFYSALYPSIHRPMRTAESLSSRPPPAQTAVKASEKEVDTIIGEKETEITTV